MPEDKSNPSTRTTGGWRIRREEQEKLERAKNKTNKTTRFAVDSEDDEDILPDAFRDEEEPERDETPVTQSKLPELPYKDVPEVAYVPLDKSQMQKAASKGRREPIPNMETREPAFKNKAPVENPLKNKEMATRLLEAEITLTAEDLLAISKPLRDEVKRIISTKKTPNRNKLLKDVVMSALGDKDTNVKEQAKDTFWDAFATAKGLSHQAATEAKLAQDAINMRDLPHGQYFVTTKDDGLVPAGSLVHKDPYLQYLETLAEGETPKQVYVAKESNALRSVYPTVNNTSIAESILDGGSQIVSIAKSEAERLNIAWDPDIRINMQSANSQIEPSCGLARNIPFRFNDITLYLQVHVIDGPAYKVLLGRPFDSLTRSLIQNEADGSQMVTITDPNTNRRAVLPTYERGKPPRIVSRPQQEEVFQFSMI